MKNTIKKIIGMILIFAIGAAIGIISVLPMLAAAVITDCNFFAILGVALGVILGHLYALYRIAESEELMQKIKMFLLNLIY